MPEIGEERLQLDRALCFDRVNDGLFLFDAEQRLLDVNTAGCVCLGSRRVDLLGKALPSLFAASETERLATALDRVGSDGGMIWESLLLRQDGTTLPAEVNVQEFSNGDAAPVLLLVLRDLSERRRDARFRQQVAGRAVHAARMEFLGLLCRHALHAYANTITAVQARAASSSDLFSADDPAGQCVADMVASTERATETLQGMRRFATRRPGSEERVDLSGVVLEMTRIVGLASTKIKLVRELPTDLPFVQGDPVQLGQIVLSLLTNAVEALGSSHGTILVRTACGRWAESDLAQTVSFEAPPPGKYVSLVVSDTGRGMNAETQQRAFEPLFSTKPAGTGLGLSPVLDVMQQSGGAVFLNSLPGAGKSFTLLFPAVRGRPVPRAVSEATPMSLWRAEGTVLVVDDDPNVLRVLAQTVLPKWGLTAVVASTGTEAVALLVERVAEIVAVLLDIALPDMSGPEVFRRIREVAPEVPVILCTGYAPEQVSGLFSGLGSGGYLEKPFGSEDVARALREVLPASTKTP